jgi:hypothetical protein
MSDPNDEKDIGLALRYISSLEFSGGVVPDVSPRLVRLCFYRLSDDVFFAPDSDQVGTLAFDSEFATKVHIKPLLLQSIAEAVEITTRDSEDRFRDLSRFAEAGISFPGHDLALHPLVYLLKKNHTVAETLVHSGAPPSARSARSKTPPRRPSTEMATIPVPRFTRSAGSYDFTSGSPETWPGFYAGGMLSKSATMGDVEAFAKKHFLITDPTGISSADIWPELVWTVLVLLNATGELAQNAQLMRFLGSSADVMHAALLHRASWKIKASDTAKMTYAACSAVSYVVACNCLASTATKAFFDFTYVGLGMPKVQMWDWLRNANMYYVVYCPSILPEPTDADADRLIHSLQRMGLGPRAATFGGISGAYTVAYSGWIAWFTAIMVASREISTWRHAPAPLRGMLDNLRRSGVDLESSTAVLPAASSPSGYLNYLFRTDAISSPFSMYAARFFAPSSSRLDVSSPQALTELWTLALRAHTKKDITPVNRLLLAIFIKTADTAVPDFLKEIAGLDGDDDDAMVYVVWYGKAPPSLPGPPGVDFEGIGKDEATYAGRSIGSVVVLDVAPPSSGPRPILLTRARRS